MNTELTHIVLWHDEGHGDGEWGYREMIVAARDYRITQLLLLGHGLAGDAEGRQGYGAIELTVGEYNAMVK